jgi:molybdopterin synthase sulfur carrier subunit
MKINVLYFAQLKQRRGCADESVETSAATVADLYHSLNEQHGLAMQLDQLKAARNEAICAVDTPLQEGDTIAFMPPMSGG